MQPVYRRLLPLLRVFSSSINKSWLRPFLLGLVVVGLGGYIFLGLLLYFEQGSLLFPAPKVYPKATPADAGLLFEDLRIPVSRTDFVHAWWIPFSSSDKVVLIFHGNGYVLEEMATSEAVLLHEVGANLLLVDYRGYGGSSSISPSESSIQEDAGAALSYLQGVRNVPAGHIYVLGRSIGSGPATQLAVENPSLGGLILESPFSSIDDAARELPVTRIYPLRWMLRAHFDNVSKIDSVKIPLLVIAGTEDTLTPIRMAEAVFERANQPKQFERISGAGHNDLLSVAGQRLVIWLRDFVGRRRPLQADAH